MAAGFLCGEALGGAGKSEHRGPAAVCRSRPCGSREGDPFSDLSAGASGSGRRRPGPWWSARRLPSARRQQAVTVGESGRGVAGSRPLPSGASSTLWVGPRSPGSELDGAVLTQSGHPCPAHTGGHACSETHGIAERPAQRQQGRQGGGPGKGGRRPGPLGLRLCSC